MTKNVFVLGLTEVQREELETVRGAADYAFRALLDVDTLTRQTEIDFTALLEAARRQLADFDGTVDAIVCHWDFPSSVLAPVLAHEHGIPAPSLDSVLRCEHKYWSRLEQQAAVPEVVPRFASFDPFADDVREQIDMAFPFWVKPVKSHSSSLGFAVHDEAELDEAVRQIRAQITDLGDAFNEALAMVDLPDAIAEADANTCLAEQIITGIQVAPEGTVFRGKFQVHGVFDMVKDEAGSSIAGLEYPAASVPAEVQQRMIDTAERLLAHIGYDNGAFNVEYMWDEADDQLWLIEVNTRISQSHSEMFADVDGVSNHEVAIDLALGREPSMPRGEGPYDVAAKYEIFHDTDAVVIRVPTREEITAVGKRFPRARVTVDVEAGQRLSELPHQDSYRYILGSVYLGAADRDDLQERYEQVVAMLPFEFAAAPDGSVTPAAAEPVAEAAV